MAHPGEDGQSPHATNLVSVGNLKTAEDLCKKFEQLKRGRETYTNQWKLNLAFYKGKQYSFYNRASRRIESLPVDDGDKPRYRVRMVSNQILTGSHSLSAKLTKTKPVFRASPGSGSDRDLKAAQMAERLLEYWWDDLQLGDKLEEVILWSIIGGNGYWSVTWDKHAGKQMRFMLDPNGQPITDEGLKDAFRAQLEYLGIPPQEQVVYLGDIRIEAVSPFDVYVDPSVSVFDDAKYLIRTQSLDPDEIKSRWGVEVKPDAVSLAPDSTIPFSNSGGAGEATVKTVYHGYFLPTAALPNGRYVCWIDAPKKILKDEPWTYPTAKLPFVKFPGIRVPGAIYDSSVVEHAIPLQKELNRTISQIVEYKNLTIKPRIWAPTGSVRTRITTEAGALYEYTPIGGFKPEVEKLPAMPPYVFEHLEKINSRLRDIFALTEVTEGSVPPNVEAGVAIDLLQEMSTDRLVPTIRLIESAIARAGDLCLSLAQRYYIEPRLLKIKGAGGSVQVKRFTQADIDGGVAVNVESGSGLPRTRAGRQARIESFIKMGVMRPDQAWKYVDMADMKNVSMIFQADEDHALREHEKMLQGQPLNPEAIQAAMAAVNQNMNPDTGLPIQSPEEAQQILINASLQPGIADNHVLHREIHGLYMKSVEFESLPPELRQAFVTHYTLTEQASMQLPQPEPIAPKVNLQIKSTAGPTVQAEILRQSGVNITKDDASEPPLETWVTDSVDKPDVDSDGPGQSGAAAATAKTLVEGVNAATESDQEMRHKEELHQQALRKAKADADLAVKKARQGPPKRTPTKAKK